jgi:hypothetical protein
LRKLVELVQAADAVERHAIPAFNFRDFHAMRRGCGRRT